MSMDSDEICIMPFAQKTVYALRAVFELTRRQGKGPIPIPVVAEAQAIPPRFLEAILLQLKGAGVLESVRESEAVTVWPGLRKR